MLSYQLGRHVRWNSMNKMFTLFPFQEDAVSALVSKFKTLWAEGSQGAPLVFKAPTGSGKTVIMAEFLRDLARDPQFDVDKCFVWVSFGGDNSYQQSYDKLFKFYDGAGEIHLLGVGDLTKKIMSKNSSEPNLMQTNKTQQQVHLIWVLRFLDSVWCYGLTRLKDKCPA